MDGLDVFVLVESWSWIASVFTRPWNKAFLSVFLVFGIWDFGCHFLSLCFFSSASSSSGTFLVSTYPPYSSSFRPAACFQNSKKKKKEKNPSIFCPCRHSFVTSYSHYLCDFWFMHANMFLCLLVVKESLVCFSSERKRLERCHADISCYWQRKKEGHTLPFFSPPIGFLGR